MLPTIYFVHWQVGCLAAEFEAQEAISSKRVINGEATLEFEWAVLAIEKVEVFKASKSLKASVAVISQKEGEINTSRVALAATQAKALADVVAD